MNIKHARKVYRLAESKGHMFDANVYLSLRADGAPADYALRYARRAYSGVFPAYRHFRGR